MTPSGSPQPRRRWTAGAIALVAVGLLILVPSGLCTGAFGIMAIAESVQRADALGALSEMIPVLIVGGPFIVGGFFLIRLGLRSRKQK